MTAWDLDRELVAHNERFRAAAAIASGEHVLDIGCGAGQTTREAGRAAAPGLVLGVDVYEPALDRARRLSEGLGNVRFELGDAQEHEFAAAAYDVAISRFGSMFFSDPVRAFTNIAGAVRPGGRLVLIVWQARERNEWAAVIEDAVGMRLPSDRPDPFALGDRDATERILEAAGWTGVGFEEVREPVNYGPDTGTALEFAGGFDCVSEPLATLPPAEAERARERLRAAFDARCTGEHGVRLESRSWLVRATRAR